MHQRILRSISAIALGGTLLLGGGCATKEAVEHAQATADQALSTAQHAQNTADGAASAAQTAGADAAKANTRLDNVESNVDHLMHHHEHGTWSDVGVKHRHHRHRMPRTETPNPAPENTKP